MLFLLSSVDIIADLGVNLGKMEISFHLIWEASNCICCKFFSTLFVESCIVLLLVAYAKNN